MVPAVQEGLETLLTQVFDRDELERICRFALGERLETIVAIENPFATIVHDLIEAVERRGSTLALLRRMRVARPDNQPFQDFCRTNFPESLQDANTTALVGTVKDAVTALAARAGDDTVRLRVGQFRADFATARDRIRALAHYKTLHDRLHTLQMRIPAIRDLVPRNGQAATDGTKLLRRYVTELKQMAKDANTSAAAVATSAIETDWVGEFARTVDDMAALGPGGFASLRPLIDELQGYLREAPRINSLLSSTAADMRLRTLVGALRDISTALNGGHGPDDAGGQRLAAGVTALALLQPELDGLVAEHAEWQWIDKELAAAELDPRFAPDQKVPRWPRFKERVTHLFVLFPHEDWAIELKELLTKWETAGAASTGDDGALALDAFDAFRVSEIHRFVDVDRELNELCKSLAEIAGPLDTVLQVVANDV